MRCTRSLLVLGAVGLAACAEPPMQPMGGADAYSSRSSVAAGRTYVLIANGNSLPADLESTMAALGGTVASRMDGIGVATVTSDDPGFAARASGAAGVRAVVADVMIQFDEPRVEGSVEAGEAATEAAHAVGGHETFRALQWAPDAISAPAAWALGYQGAGARVAILDGGIHDKHIDIAPNLDVSRSVSMVPGQPFNFDQALNEEDECVLPNSFWHGTHVAGIVAAPANNIGTVGIAPKATIIGVKVLHCGSGFFSWIINGIYYAATPISEGGAGAHIINLSLGAGIDGRGPGIAHLLAALSRSTSYARQRGTTVIAALGNDAFDLDHTNNLVFVPAQSVGVVSVAATGPSGWQLGFPDFDRPASYTNFGQSATTLAGPGGDFAWPGNEVCVVPRFPTGSVVQFCWVMDMVMAPSRGGPTSISSYSWAAGTSMASPAVAGVAALIVGKYGPLSPAQVEARLRQSADDINQPGNDDFSGRGRVNALRAVQ